MKLLSDIETGLSMLITSPVMCFPPPWFQCPATHVITEVYPSCQLEKHSPCNGQEEAGLVHELYNHNDLFPMLMSVLIKCSPVRCQVGRNSTTNIFVLIIAELIHWCARYACFIQLGTRWCWRSQLIIPDNLWFWIQKIPHSSLSLLHVCSFLLAMFLFLSLSVLVPHTARLSLRTPALLSSPLLSILSSLSSPLPHLSRPLSLSLSPQLSISLNPLRPRQNGRHYPNDIFKCIFANESVCISINIYMRHSVFMSWDATLTHTYTFTDRDLDHQKHSFFSRWFSCSLFTLYVCMPRCGGAYQIRKIVGCACTGNAGNVFTATDFKGNRWLAIPACITARASRTCPDACRDR